MASAPGWACEKGGAPRIGIPQACVARAERRGADSERRRERATPAGARLLSRMPGQRTRRAPSGMSRRPRTDGRRTRARTTAADQRAQPRAVGVRSSRAAAAHSAGVILGWYRNAPRRHRASTRRPRTRVAAPRAGALAPPRHRPRGETMRRRARSSPAGHPPGQPGEPRRGTSGRRRFRRARRSPTRGAIARSARSGTRLDCRPEALGARRRALPTTPQRREQSRLVNPAICWAGEGGIERGPNHRGVLGNSGHDIRSGVRTARAAATLRATPGRTPLSGRASHSVPPSAHNTAAATETSAPASSPPAECPRVP